MDISTLENERRRAIQQQGEERMGVSGGWNIAEGKGGSPGTPTPDWDKGWPDKGTKPRPEDSPNIPTKLAHFLAPSGTGNTLSDEWYEKGLETILETTEPGSWQQKERLNILEHQYLDQVNNPAMRIATHDKPLFKTPPAAGAGADNMAPDWLIDYMNRKDENLLQLQDRLKRVEAPGAMQIASVSDIGQQVLQQRAAESKAGKIDRGSRSYIGEDHQRAREIDGEIYWYDEYKHMPFYQKILQKYGHTEELQQIRNEISQ